MKVIIMEKTIIPRGRKFTGPIHTSRMTKTAIFEMERRKYLPKYERYEKRRTRIKVHVPEGMEITDGDVVTIQETRPLSKTKTFVIVENHTQTGTLKTRKEKAAARKSAKKPAKSSAQKSESSNTESKKETKAEDKTKEKAEEKSEAKE